MIRLIGSMSAVATLAFLIGLFVSRSSASVPEMLFAGFGFVGSAIVFAGTLIVEQIEENKK